MLKGFFNNQSMLIAQDVDGADIWGPGPGQMIPIDPDLGETPILVPQPG